MITETPNFKYAFDTLFLFYYSISCVFNEFRERNSANDEKTVNLNLSKNFNFDKKFYQSPKQKQFYNLDNASRL